MPMDQAKWYYICFHYKLPLPNTTRRLAFLCHCFLYHLNSYEFKRICGRTLVGVEKMYWFEIPIFCGQKKLKKLIEEAHLLGLEDELLIFERRKLK